MANEFGESFVTSNASHLLKKAAGRLGRIAPPVDPIALVQDCGILSVQYRHMIPEGVLQPTAGGFALYVQDNFEELPGNRLRQRFTIAHEIAHTFFFDQALPTPKPRRGAPRGVRLEGLCHLGASELLLPQELLEQEFRDRDALSELEDVQYLADRFQVSMEVLLRRLKRSPELCPTETVVVYARGNTSSGGQVRAEFHDATFLPLASPPKVGADFGEWMSQIEPQAVAATSGSWDTTLKSTRVRIRKKSLGQWASLVEIRRLG